MYYRDLITKEKKEYHELLKKAIIFPEFNSKRNYYMALYMRNIEKITNRVSNNSSTKEAETLFLTLFSTY